MRTHNSGATKNAAKPKPTTTVKHPNIMCDVCKNLVGDKTRYKCLDCENYDMCADCEAKNGSTHSGGSHTFVRIQDSNTFTPGAQQNDPNTVSH